MTYKKFKEKYCDRTWEVQDDGGVTSSEFDRFARDLKSALKEICGTDWEVRKYSKGHYFVSTFLRNTANPDKFLYLNFSDIRYNPDWHSRILYRTAENETDYTGGANRYSSLEDLSRALESENRIISEEAQKSRESAPDDTTISKEQIQEAKEERQHIVKPILDGEKSGLYLAFKSFDEKGVFEIKGQKMDMADGRITETGWKQLEAAMEIYRSKKFETFRYVLIDRKSGEIRDQLAISSHMPNFCAASLPEDETLMQVAAQAERLDCLVAVCHNHPSGNTVESVFDRELTVKLEESLQGTRGNRFAGHIILDHGNFNLYVPDEGWKTVKTILENEKDPLELDEKPEWAKKYAGSASALVEIARKIDGDGNWGDEYIPVTFTNIENEILAIQYYERDFFKSSPENVREAFIESAFDAGTVSAFPIITESLWERLSESERTELDDCLKNHVSNHAFRDAVLGTMTVTEKYGLSPDGSYYDIIRARAQKNIDIKSTWETENAVNIPAKSESMKAAEATELSESEHHKKDGNQNATSQKFERIIIETFFTLTEEEKSEGMTEETKRRCFESQYKPTADEIKAEIAMENAEVIKEIENFSEDKSIHKTENSWYSEEEAYRNAVTRRLIPSLYEKTQDRIKAELDEKKIPYIQLGFSESSDFGPAGKIYALKEFNEILTDADSVFHNRRTYAIEKYGDGDKYWELEKAGKIPDEDKGIRFGYDKTEFKIFNIPNPANPKEFFTYEPGRYDIGDGNGSVFDYIREGCSYDGIVEGMNRLEEEIYFPHITDAQKLFVERAIASVAKSLRNNSEAAKKAVEQAERLYESAHSQILIDKSQWDKAEGAQKESLAAVRKAYDDALGDLYSRILNEYPFAPSDGKNSEFMRYIANSAKRMVEEELYRPTRESQKAMSDSKSSEINWSVQHKIWSAMPHAVNLDDYTQDLLWEAAEKRRISVSEREANGLMTEKMVSEYEKKAQEYKNALRIAYADDTVSEKDRTLLDGLRARLGLSEEECETFEKPYFLAKKAEESGKLLHFNDICDCHHMHLCDSDGGLRWETIEHSTIEYLEIGDTYIEKCHGGYGTFNPFISIGESINDLYAEYGEKFFPEKAAEDGKIILFDGTEFGTDGTIDRYIETRFNIMSPIEIEETYAQSLGIDGKGLSDYLRQVKDKECYDLNSDWENDVRQIHNLILDYDDADLYTFKMSQDIQLVEWDKKDRPIIQEIDTENGLKNLLYELRDHFGGNEDYASEVSALNRLLESLEKGINRERYLATLQTFEDDREKMEDFLRIPKDEFLADYGYLAEEEYDATAKKVDEKFRLKEPVHADISLGSLFDGIISEAERNAGCETVALSGGNTIERSGSEEDGFYYDMRNKNDGKYLAFDGMKAIKIAEINGISYFTNNDDRMDWQGEVFSLNDDEVKLAFEPHGFCLAPEDSKQSEVKTALLPYDTAKSIIFDEGIVFDKENGTVNFYAWATDALMEQFVPSEKRLGLEDSSNEFSFYFNYKDAQNITLDIGYYGKENNRIFETFRISPESEGYDHLKELMDTYTLETDGKHIDDYKALEGLEILEYEELSQIVNAAATPLFSDEMSRKVTGYYESNGIPLYRNERNELFVYHKEHDDPWHEYNDSPIDKCSPSVIIGGFIEEYSDNLAPDQRNQFEKVRESLAAEEKNKEKEIVDSIKYDLMLTALNRSSDENYIDEDLEKVTAEDIEYALGSDILDNKAEIEAFYDEYGVEGIKYAVLHDSLHPDDYTGQKPEPDMKYAPMTAEKLMDFINIAAFDSFDREMAEECIRTFADNKMPLAYDELGNVYAMNKNTDEYNPSGVIDFYRDDLERQASLASEEWFAEHSQKIEPLHDIEDYLLEIENSVQLTMKNAYILSDYVNQHKMEFGKSFTKTNGNIPAFEDMTAELAEDIIETLEAGDYYVRFDESTKQFFMYDQQSIADSLFEKVSASALVSKATDITQNWNRDGTTEHENEICVRLDKFLYPKESYLPVNITAEMNVPQSLKKNWVGKNSSLDSLSEGISNFYSEIESAVIASFLPNTAVSLRKDTGSTVTLSISTSLVVAEPYSYEKLQTEEEQSEIESFLSEGIGTALQEKFKSYIEKDANGLPERITFRSIKAEKPAAERTWDEIGADWNDRDFADARERSKEILEEHKGNYTERELKEETAYQLLYDYISVSLDLPSEELSFNSSLLEEISEKYVSKELQIAEAQDYFDEKRKEWLDAHSEKTADNQTKRKCYERYVEVWKQDHDFEEGVSEPASFGEFLDNEYSDGKIMKDYLPEYLFAEYANDIKAAYRNKVEQGSGITPGEADNLAEILSLLDEDSIRPNGEQILTGLENGWDFDDVCNGYIQANDQDLLDGVLVIMQIDDMQVFRDDHSAAIQAQKDGIKLISGEELNFESDEDGDPDERSYYDCIDTPENRRLLQEAGLLRNMEKESGCPIGEEVSLDLNALFNSDKYCPHGFSLENERITGRNTQWLENTSNRIEFTREDGETYYDLKDDANTTLAMDGEIVIVAEHKNGMYKLIADEDSEMPMTFYLCDEDFEIATGKVSLSQLAAEQTEQNKNDTLLEEAKDLISDFCFSEYTSTPDFADLQHIEIAYTDYFDPVTQKEYPVQVSVNLVEPSISATLGGKELWKDDDYEDLQDFIATNLRYLDYDSLVSVADYDINAILKDDRSSMQSEPKESKEGGTIIELNGKQINSLADYLTTKRTEGNRHLESAVGKIVREADHAEESEEISASVELTDNELRSLKTLLDSEKPDIKAGGFRILSDVISYLDDYENERIVRADGNCIGWEDEIEDWLGKNFYREGEYFNGSKTTGKYSCTLSPSLAEPIEESELEIFGNTDDSPDEILSRIKDSKFDKAYDTKVADIVSELQEYMLATYDARLNQSDVQDYLLDNDKLLVLQPSNEEWLAREPVETRERLIKAGISLDETPENTTQEENKMKRKEETEERKPMPIYTYSPFGYDGAIVQIETDLRRGIPAYDIVGISDGVVKETRERIRAAFRNSGFDFPAERVLQSASPADLRKDGPFDLALAVSILAQTEDFINEPVMVLGSLELSGVVRPVRGNSAAVTIALDAGIRNIVCDPMTAKEIEGIKGIRILKVANLKETNAGLCSLENFREVGTENTQAQSSEIEFSTDYDDDELPAYAQGNYETIRAMEIAAAGKHNILIAGTPGCGKTMLNQNLLPKITPKLTSEENMTLQRIRSIAGLYSEDDKTRTAPFRMPHQSATLEGMVGGGTQARPGEISLAQHGVLFMDEAAEFRSTVLQLLRIPLDSRSITLSRSGRTTVYPADFQLSLAMNPCPCGNYRSANRLCLDSAKSIEQYWGKISKPLLDRIEIKNFMRKDDSDKRTMSLAEMRSHVAAAIRIQRDRGTYNSHLTPQQIIMYCKISDEDKKLLDQYAERNGISQRNIANTLKVALTVANMDGRTQIRTNDLKEAIEMTAPVFDKPREYHLAPAFPDGKTAFDGLTDLIREDITGAIGSIDDKIKINGMRFYAPPEDDGKLHLAVEFESDHWREDGLFNALAEEYFTLEGREVDVNPITPGKSGTLDEYITRVDEMRKAVAENGKETEKNEEMRKNISFFVTETHEFRGQMLETNLTAKEAFKLAAEKNKDSPGKYGVGAYSPDYISLNFKPERGGDGLFYWIVPDAKNPSACEIDTTLLDQRPDNFVLNEVKAQIEEARDYYVREAAETKEQGAESANASVRAKNLVNSATGTEITSDDLKYAKTFLPKSQYVLVLQNTQGEEGEHFKQIIKTIADKARSIEGKSEITDENGKHPLAFKYTFGSNTTFYLSEWNGQDEVFGYTVLNGDTQNSEWGYSSLSEIRDLSVKAQNGFPVTNEMTFYGLEPTVEKMAASDYPALAAEMDEEKKSREEEMIQKFSRELNEALTEKNLTPSTENIALASYHVLQSMDSAERKEIIGLMEKCGCIDEEKSNDFLSAVKNYGTPGGKTKIRQAIESLRNPNGNTPQVEDELEAGM